MMKFKLENPQHQITAIRSVVKVFRGMERNTYDNAHIDDIHSNVCSLSQQELMDNIKRVITENNVPATQSGITESNDACIEMGTGTGKTFTYIQTAYELYKEYGFTKFIVLVPSIPIRQGAIDTFDNFKEQLEDKYDIQANAFVYDSSKLSKLRDFITQDTPQIMVMTMASFNSDDKILNQSEREGLFNNESYLKAIAHTHPIIFMDEPQEGMDTDNSTSVNKEQIWSLQLEWLIRRHFHNLLDILVQTQKFIDFTESKSPLAFKMPAIRKHAEIIPLPNLKYRFEEEDTFISMVAEDFVLNYNNR